MTCVMPGATRTAFEDNSGSTSALVWRLPLVCMEADEASRVLIASSPLEAASGTMPVNTNIQAMLSSFSRASVDCTRLRRVPLRR